MAAAKELRFPYDYEVVDIEALIIDRAYQPVERVERANPDGEPWASPMVKQIEREFDPALIGVLSVSLRDNGKYAVIDGQTRLTAIKNKNVAYAKEGERDHIGRRQDEDYQPIRHLPCLVYYGLQRADEAYLFAKLQTERRRVTAFQRFKAELAAKDPEARAIEKIITGSGLTLGEGSPSGGRDLTGVITAVTQVERVYRRDETLLREVAFVCAACWGDDREGIRGEILAGLAQFISDQPNVQLERLIDRLHGTTQLELRRRSAALREGRGGGYNMKNMAEVIAAEYRKPARRAA